MKKPEVTLENYEQVYDYYQQYDQPMFGAKLGHYAMGLIFKPNTEFAPGAEDAVEAALQDDKTRTVVAFNHLSDNDQYVVSAMAIKEPAFKPMVGNTFIQSKEPLFHHPNKILRPFLRRGVDIMGAIPAFRKKDVDDSSADLRRLATARMLETSVQKIRDGKFMAIFPEGTRNKENPEQVQPLRPGISAVIGQTATTHEVNIIPVGFTYEHNKHKPQMRVEMPELYSNIGESELLPWLQTSLQHAVDSARLQALIRTNK